MAERLASEGLIVLQLLVAVILALPTAWHREVHTRIMGLRTFPLVAVGACAYITIGETFIGDNGAEAMSRIVAGLITGIGFVGGGAILKNKDHVSGTATATSIWVTGALGAAVGFQLWIVAVLLSAFNFLIIWLLSRFKTGDPTAEGA